MLMFRVRLVAIDGSMHALVTDDSKYAKLFLSMFSKVAKRIDLKIFRVKAILN